VCAAPELGPVVRTPCRLIQWGCRLPGAEAPVKAREKLLLEHACAPQVGALFAVPYDVFG
jgi:hypothetical protein